MLFALVLTIVAYRGMAATTVHGFTDQRACIAAGDAWLAKVQGLTYSQNGDARAICMRVR